ncbi:hypothetical protein [Roseibium aggregatum]|uniref:hypothetical protein n=1 Tax=Roseibium aggregatum TaxID=187304 RepID=UPI003A7F422A
MATHADQRQPGTKFEQKMGHTDVGITASQVYEMFDDHRLVPGRGPQNGSRQAGGLCEGCKQIIGRNFSCLNIGDRFEAVVRGAQQNTSQSQEIPRDLEIDDLP